MSEAHAQLDVVIAAGGTAGHVNPALALAEELVDRGHHVRFVGQRDRLEGELVPKAGYELMPIVVRGFDRSRPWTLVTVLRRMAAAERVLGRDFDAGRAPDVAVGFGAYVEVPLMRWCRAHGVPCVLHEQNSVPGLANKICARWTRVVCVSFPAAAAVFEGRVKGGGEVVLTGNPVRRSVTAGSRAEARRSLGIPDDATVLLVFGGSLGARHVNEGVARLKRELLSRERLYVLHSTGKGEHEATVERLALSDEERVRWRVVPYLDDMGGAYAACDLVLSRSGASSVAEIAACAVPSILVPYPLATKDHQTTNAHYLTDAGAAVLVSDDDIDTVGFSGTLLGLLDDPVRRNEMAAAARSLTQARAADALADRVEAAARGTSGSGV